MLHNGLFIPRRYEHGLVADESVVEVLGVNVKHVLCSTSTSQQKHA